MPKRIVLLTLGIFALGAAYFVFVFGSTPAFAQATYDTYSRTFGTCPAPDAFNACVTITGSASGGTAQFTISSRIKDTNPDGSPTVCPTATYSGSGGASGWSGELGCDGRIVRTVSGSGDGGTSVLTGAGGLDAGYITWAVPYSGEPNQICYRISWNTIGNSSAADACVTKKAAAAMDVTNLAGPVKVTVGDAATYSADFTWSGDSATWLFDLVNPSSVVVQTANGSLTSSPQTKSVVLNQFTTAGTYKVCATGSATGGLALEASDTECISVVAEARASVDLKADGSNGPIAKVVGQSAFLNWTAENVSDKCDSSSTGPAAVPGWENGQKWNKVGSTTAGPFSVAGSYTLTLTCFSLAAGNPIIKIAHAAVGDAIGDDVGVDVAAGPDLAITSYSYTPSTPKPADIMGFYATIKNIGSAAADAADTRLRVFSPSGVLIYEYSQGPDALPLAAGAYTTFGWSVPVSEEGTHTFEIFTDWNGKVGESNENNNKVTGSFIVRIPRPNLIVESITISPAAPRAGDLVTFTGRVKNIGDARARDSQTRLRIDEDGNGTYDFSPSNLNTSPLEPGGFEDKTWNAVWRAKASNKVIAEIYADVTNLVAESSETDNARTIEFPVGAEKTLSVTLGASPSSGTAPLNNVDLTAAVSGTAAGAINYTFYCDATKAASATFVGINDNPKTVVDLCDYATSGTYTAKVIVGRDGLTAEGLAAVSVSGEGVPSGPDLTIPGEININPSSPVQGNLLSFSVTVQNIGDATAASSKTRLRLDVGNNGSWDVIPAPIDTGSMPPGSTDFEVWSNIWTASAGTHKVNVCADYTKIISESNEINNCKDKTFTVAAAGGSPPDLEILGSLTLSPSSPSAGQRVTFSAVANNRGEGSAPDSKTRLLIDVNNDGDAERWDVIADENTGPLNPGQSENETWLNAWTAVTGTHRLWACADGPNNIAESLETNNCTEKYITVTGPPPNSPPAAVNPSVSSGNVCTSPLNPTLSWTFTDPDQGDSQTAYQVQVKRTDRGYGESEVSTGKVNSSSDSYTIPAGILQFNITYNWRVKVWDQADATSEWALGPNFTTQEHAGPDVDFSWAPTSPLVNETTQFADQTQTFSGATIASWLWSFQSGNPASSVIQNPQTKFTSQGTKTVTLTITDSDSIQCSTSKNLEVGLPAPEFREIRP